MGRWTQLGQRRVWRACGIAVAVQIGKKPAPGPGCVRTRRNLAAPPALDVRPPLPPRAFCSRARPAVRRAWACRHGERSS